MRSNRLRTSWLALLCAAALVAGCGDDDGNAGDDDGASADAAPVDTPDAAPADADTRDILDRLRDIPGLTVSEDTAAQLPTGYRLFRMSYDQPVDHAKPDGQRFLQRMWLLHRDEHAPMVQFSSGYFLSGTARRTELARLLNGNMLALEHRWFEPSRPDPADWQYLTIEQSAADFHRINAALKPIYDGAWLSTGASKGGMTAIFFRRFYPDDVDATVAYVAPIMNAGGDTRFAPFIAEAGDDPACNAALVDFQKHALQQKTALLDIATTTAMQNNWSYDILGQERALEHAIIELPFYFWQYGDASGCPMIPGANADAAALWSFIDTVSSLGNVSDAFVEPYAPFFWQEGLEFGWPKFPEEQLAGLLAFPGSDNPITYSQTSAGEAPVFDATAMPDVIDWIQTSGERIIFIYGENDPWSAAMVDPGNAKDSFRFVVPAGNHGSNIARLTEADRATTYDALQRWTGVTPASMKPGQPEEGPDPLWDTPRRGL